MERIDKLAEKFNCSKNQIAVKYFKEQGCELLEDYKQCLKPMKYRCKCGRLSVINWNNFTKGKRCGYCGSAGRRKKYALAEVKKIFDDRGCKLLETNYQDNKHSMRYLCKCGRESKISLAGFIHQDQYCYFCGLEKNKGKNHHCWKEDREKFELDRLFRKKCYAALRNTLKATGKEKIGKTNNMLGYGPKELQHYIINHPNWQNVKDKKWHLDHIFPMNAFLEHGIYDVKLINSLDNLQPLDSKENISKSANYDKETFYAWVNYPAAKDGGASYPTNCPLLGLTSGQ